jgi:hypothetical protein
MFPIFNIFRRIVILIVVIRLPTSSDA